MSQLLKLLPEIVLAQALGVGAAWGVDALSWKWRNQNEEPDDGFSFGAVTLLLPLLACLVLCLWIDTKNTTFVLEWIFVPTLLWLLLVTWVQKRQRATSWRSTFFGAMMQFVCFVMALLIGGVMNLLLGGLIFTLTWLLSATLFHALLSLFRLTIHGVWNTWRQNGKK